MVAAYAALRTRHPEAAWNERPAGPRTRTHPEFVPGAASSDVWDRFRALHANLADTVEVVPAAHARRHHAQARRAPEAARG